MNDTRTLNISAVLSNILNLMLWEYCPLPLYEYWEYCPLCPISWCCEILSIVSIILILRILSISWCCETPVQSGRTVGCSWTYLVSREWMEGGRVEISLSSALHHRGTWYNSESQLSQGVRDVLDWTEVSLQCTNYWIWRWQKLRRIFFSAKIVSRDNSMIKLQTSLWRVKNNEEDVTPLSLPQWSECSSAVSVASGAPAQIQEAAAARPLGTWQVTPAHRTKQASNLRRFNYVPIVIF